MIRQAYLKIRTFFYSRRYLFNKVAIFLMTSCLIYLFVNSFLINSLLMDKAKTNHYNHLCRNSIAYYNAAFLYYSFNHFSKQNKENYYEIPYLLADCYLQQNNKSRANQVMYNFLSILQKENGTYSKETAYFMRKYLIQYFLETNQTVLAKKEFDNLLVIYKRIGYDNSIMADLADTSGDFSFYKKNYYDASVKYKQAFNILSAEKKPDYVVLTRTIYDVANIEIINGNKDKAIIIYENALNRFFKTKNNHKESYVEMLINSGDLYAQENGFLANAIKNYTEAISIIKTLPKTSYLNENLVLYYENLIDFYNRNGQSYKAKDIEIELAKMRRFNF